MRNDYVINPIRKLIEFNLKLITFRSIINLYFKTMEVLKWVTFNTVKVRINNSIRYGYFLWGSYHQVLYFKIPD